VVAADEVVKGYQAGDGYIEISDEDLEGGCARQQLPKLCTTARYPNSA
jgi:non-homologous end joining protein Ku